MALTEAGGFSWTWLGGASPPTPPDCPSPQTPLGKEILHGRRSVASLCWGFQADPNLSLAQVWASFSAIQL